MTHVLSLFPPVEPVVKRPASQLVLARLVLLILGLEVFALCLGMWGSLELSGFGLSVWPALMAGALYFATTVACTSAVLDFYYCDSEISLRLAGLVAVGFFVSVFAFVWVEGSFFRAQATSVSRLTTLPATLPFRAATVLGPLTGTLSAHDLSCGTLDTLIAGGYDSASPAFEIPSRGTASGDAVVQTRRLSVTSLKVDPAAVAIITAVPGGERHWLWRYLGCPGTSWSGSPSVQLNVPQLN